MRSRIIITILLVSVLGCTESSTDPRDKLNFPGFDSEYFKKRDECANKPLADLSKFTNYGTGKSLHVVGQRSNWKTQQMYLGNTCHKASIGPVYYEGQSSPSYYSIDIEVKQKSNGPQGYSWAVIFSRDLPISQLSESELTKPIKEIVSYDQETNKVKFLVGSQNYEYELPKP